MPRGIYPRNQKRSQVRIARREPKQEFPDLAPMEIYQDEHSQELGKLHQKIESLEMENKELRAELLTLYRSFCTSRQFATIYTPKA